MLEFEMEQKFSAQGTLAGADTSLTLKSASSVETLVVTSVILTTLTAGAQALYVGDESGTVKVLSLPASKPDAGNQASIQLLNGIALTKGEDLIVKPAAAAPNCHVVAEGYIRRS
jgi:hypothetical protein